MSQCLSYSHLVNNFNAFFNNSKIGYIMFQLVLVLPSFTQRSDSASVLLYLAGLVM